jgi:hypothetical protein
MESLSFYNTRLSQWPGRGVARLRRPPAWVMLSIAAFCVIELVLVGYARATSVAAHLHAVRSLTPSSSPGEAASTCAEADAALTDLGPALLLLNLARIMPFPTARAWGEVPRLAEAAQIACRSIEVWVSVAPWRDGSLEKGVAVDVVTDMRRQRQQLTLAVAELAQAASLLDTIDLDALSAEPRLERAARIVRGLRAQRADVAEALALATPERAEGLLGGRGTVAWVLEVRDGGDISEAHVLLKDGSVIAVEVGAPTAPAGVVVSVDRPGLSTILAAVGSVPVPEIGGRVSAIDFDDALQRSPPASTGAIARAILLEITQKTLSSDLPALSAVKKSVEQRQASLWFEDAALQSLVIQHGWAPP